MANRDLLGHIDCPTCRTVAGMRITEDKNGDPFGYCEANCSQQYRVGGDRRRVEAFYATHTNIKRAGSSVTVSEKNAQEEPEAKAPTVPVPVQKTPVIVKRSPMAEALAFMTGTAKND